MIHVFAYRELERWVRPDERQWLVSILGPSDNLPWPEFRPTDRHLRLCFDDNVHRGFGPDGAHIQELIAFFRRWALDGPLLIHCHGGISRSPAAALIALSVFNPGHEREIASVFRQLAPHADPNETMIRLADDLLGLNGRLFCAVDDMSDPTGWGRSRDITLPVHLDNSGPTP